MRSSPRISLRAVGATDAGSRAVNEDALLVAPALGLFAVCDGVAGRLGGARASAEAVATIESFVRARLRDAGPQRELGDAAARRDALGRLLRAALVEANAALLRRGREEPAVRGLATTASALLVVGDDAALAHIGDSRIYRIRGAEVTQLTRDHSFAAWAERGGVDPDRAARLRGVTEVLGLRDVPQIDVAPVDVAPGDRLLLCTDGLYARLADDATIAALVGGPLEGVAARALDHARVAASVDNITAVVVDCAAAS
ncbi:MAG: PP2C family serine/threonine-protein phosphatase [Nannocystaceae bacterium]